MSSKSLRTTLTKERASRRLYSCQGLIILLMVLLQSAAHAQASRLMFEQLGIEDGLAATEGRPLLQDRYGFIWIGTVDGLERYDGYSFTHYQHKPFDAASLTANAITALLREQPEPAGRHVMSFTASGLASGIYFYKLEATVSNGALPLFVETKTMTHLK